MGRELFEVIYSTSSYPHVPAMCDQLPGYLTISEDDKITRRLSPSSVTCSRLEEMYIQSDHLTGSPLCRDDADASQSPRREMSEPVNEIHLDSLNASDEIVIKTAHSIYRFTVDNPTIPSGRLIGGVLGNQSVGAALIPGRGKNGSSRPAHKKLTVGLKVIFLIEWGNSLRRLTTSAITGLVHGKSRRSRSVSGSPRLVRLEHVSSGQSDR